MKVRLTDQLGCIPELSLHLQGLSFLLFPGC